MISDQLKKNRTLETITNIERSVQAQCGDLNLEHDFDRAKLSWWIFNNFCKADYKEFLHLFEVANPRRVTTNEIKQDGKEGA